MISFDATRRALEACREGKIAFVGECNPLLGELAAEVIRTVENGETAEKYHYVTERGFVASDITDALLADRKY